MATKLSLSERTMLIDHLVGNCDCSDAPLFTEEDKDRLGNLKDSQLIELARNADDEEEEEVVEEEEAEVEESEDDSEDDTTPQTNKDVEEEEEEEVEDEEEMEGKPPFKSNPKKKKTKKVFNESDLPASVREDLQFARNMKQQKKDQLIAQITSNESGLFTKRELNTKDIDELTKIASYVSNAVATETEDEELPVKNTSTPRLGGHFRPVNNSVADLQNENLDIPVMNWNE